MDEFRYSQFVPTTDEQIGKNVAAIRGSMSQRELATNMRELGFKWSHLTVASVERGERPLRLNEATALVELFGLQSVQSISAPVGEFEYLVTLSLYQDAARDLVAAADNALRLQRRLAEELDEQKVDSRDRATWAEFSTLLRVTPTELVYDHVRDSLPLLRASAEASGPWSEALSKAVENTLLTSPTSDIVVEAPQ
jgi:hypothetical protein